MIPGYPELPLFRGLRVSFLEHPPIYSKGLIGERFFNRLLGVSSDGPLIVIPSHAFRTVEPLTVKLKQIATELDPSLLPRLENVAEIRITKFMTPHSSVFDADTMAGLLSLPRSAAPGGLGRLASVQAMATDKNLKINDQLAAIHAFLGMLNDPAELKNLGKIAMIDAIAGNEDRILKGNLVPNLTNIMLGRKASGGMCVVAIDNGGTCIDFARINKRAEGDPSQYGVRVFDSAVDWNEKQRWLGAITNGYNDFDSGFLSVDLAESLDLGRSSKKLTNYIIESLFGVLERLRSLDEKGILVANGSPKGASEYQKILFQIAAPAQGVPPIPPPPSWTIRLAARVEAGSGASPKGGVMFAKDGKAVTINWVQVADNIMAGMNDGAKSLTANSGGANMIQPGIFGSSVVGRLVSEVGSSASSNGGQPTGDILDPTMVLLRAYYIHLRVDKRVSHDLAVPLLEQAYGIVNLVN